MQGRTTFVIAQRVSTVLHADQIIVLDHGAVVGIGTHSELLESNSIYAEIYHLQLMDESVVAALGEERVATLVGAGAGARATTPAPDLPGGWVPGLGWADGDNGGSGQNGNGHQNGGVSRRQGTRQ